MKINWDALSAISTFGAVVVALFLPWWQNRRRMYVRVIPPQIYGIGEKASILIVNGSNTPETIVRVLWKDRADHRIKELVQNFDLPKTLQVHGMMELDSPFLAYNINSILEILVEDSFGNQWKCDKKTFMNAKKLLRNHEGVVGRIYPKK